MAMLYPLSDPKRAALAALVPLGEVTHRAQATGDWSAPATWDTGTIPGAGAKVYIPAAHTVTYDVTTTPPSLTWIRLEGTLTAKRGLALQMKVDTFITDLSSVLDFGTKASPLGAGSSMVVTFADNGALNPAIDTLMIGRGLVTLGKVDIHGEAKSPWHYIEGDLSVGATSLTLAETPTNWNVGDTIILGASRFEGQHNDGGGSGIMHNPQTETRTIAAISGSTITWAGGLTYVRTAGELGQKIPVGNATRNIIFQSEGGDATPFYQRGHIMFMHNSDVRAYYAAALWMGRTRKNKSKTSVDYAPARDGFEFGAGLAADSNVKGRYAWHLHKSGVDSFTPGKCAEFVGLYAAHSPGWLFAHHDSTAVFHKCFGFDAAGAGLVAESGNERGQWTDCLMMQMINPEVWASNKNADGHSGGEYDIAMVGNGFDTHSRQLSYNNCVANTCNIGHSFFHRGRKASDPYDGVIDFNAADTEVPDLWGFDRTSIGNNAHPIMHTTGLVAIACNQGIHVEKAGAGQDNDFPTVFETPSVYSCVSEGIAAAYTAHYVWLDPRIEGIPAGTGVPGQVASHIGFRAGTNSNDQNVIRPVVHGFDHAFRFGNRFTAVDGLTNAEKAALRNHHVAEQTVTNIAVSEFLQDEYYSDGDCVTQIASIAQPMVSVENLVWDTAEFTSSAVNYTINKTDSIATYQWPYGKESSTRAPTEIRGLIDNLGYWKDTNDNRYVYVPLYFHDRMSGLIEKFYYPLRYDHKKNGNNGGTDHGFLSDPASALHVDNFRPPVHGVIRPKAGTPGVFNYYPLLGFNGSEALEYWMTDGRGMVERRTTMVNAAGISYPNAIEIDLSSGAAVPKLVDDMSFVVEVPA